ncbi:asparagine synthase (glutamine-hydrolyzing) [uncultured Eudoraea sp.]|uniref:asparagine synthase (glutamine-hydrolyzing) n=1 Tax=uncultured Eudoraea sp. TaxID=1035614 RepID=UPI002636799B|nr:asparagine synthase (glutamine-hydrolyzing) [uncultured Eudoraea sp.]
MCGICGKIHFDRDRPVRKDDLLTMTNLIRHRGPDDCGQYLKKNVGLGFRRLSIIDLEKGHQPLSNEDGTIWIVFNGEIYNHNELRKSLIQKGHEFKTKSDTETIVHAYEEYGVDCVSHLRGMFAFAIWDENENSLFCARDRFGIKPFFYCLEKDTFLFGSEMKCIMSQSKNSMDLSIFSLDYYLAFGYSAQDGTIFQNIHKLKPAHSLLLKDNGHIQVSKYWHANYEPDYSKSESEWSELLREKLSETVKSHLMSDVPLGAFLSGGIDSSSVVALMAQHSSSPVKTFSIGFKEARFNELKYAREVAAKYQTEHHELIVEPESVSLLPDLIDAYDEPFADSSAIPTYYVSKFARENVTVALSGDGGDELFLGYHHHLKFKRIHKYNILPSSLSRYLWGGLHDIIPNGVKGKGATYYLSKPKSSAPAYHSIWQLHERQQLFRKECWEMLKASPAEQQKVYFYTNGNSSNYLFNMQRMDMQTYMVDDILTKVDRASMQNSLEVRVPLLDHEFAELTFNIPAKLKLKGKTSKYIFKEAMKDLLPPSIISHKKQGFSVPLELWFKEDLKEYVNDRLLSTNSPLYEYLDPTYVRKIIHDHNNGMRDFSRKIWSLIFLDQWLTTQHTSTLASV